MLKKSHTLPINTEEDPIEIFESSVGSLEDMGVCSDATESLRALREEGLPKRYQKALVAITGQVSQAQFHRSQSANRSLFAN